MPAVTHQQARSTRVTLPIAVDPFAIPMKDPCTHVLYAHVQSSSRNLNAGKEDLIYSKFVTLFVNLLTPNPRRC